ncbi:MAG: hypothetical protein K9K84_11480 [Methylovulum sp.]|nr:hypothetical protein [Methylovulum sp.]
MSQKTLAEDWLKPEEDETWAHSQTEQIAETKEHRFDGLFGSLKPIKPYRLKKRNKRLLCKVWSDLMIVLIEKT